EYVAGGGDFHHVLCLTGMPLHLIFYLSLSITFCLIPIFLKIPLVFLHKLDQRIQGNLKSLFSQRCTSIILPLLNNLLIDCQCYMGKMKVIINVHMSRTYFITIIQVLEGYFLGKMMNFGHVVVVISLSKFHHYVVSFNGENHAIKNITCAVNPLGLGFLIVERGYNGGMQYMFLDCIYLLPIQIPLVISTYFGYKYFFSGDLGWMRGKNGLLANAAIFIEKAIMLVLKNSYLKYLLIAITDSFDKKRRYHERDHVLLSSIHSIGPEIEREKVQDSRVMQEYQGMKIMRSLIEMNEKGQLAF
ncbi:hypothetical protein ACJX0J_012998, partial [Zea mays]